MSNSTIFFGTEDDLIFSEFPKFIADNYTNNVLSTSLINSEFPKFISSKFIDHVIISFDVTVYPVMPAITTHPRI